MKQLTVVNKIPKFVRIILVMIVLGGIGWGVKSKFFSSTKSSTSYQTTTVEKGTLISSISSTGTITSANKTSITTGATGTIKSVSIKNGDTVTNGQKIAEITLDDDGSKNQATAWANYVSAQESYKKALADQSTADIQMWNDRQTLLDAQDEYRDAMAGAWNPKTNKEYSYNEKAVLLKAIQQAQLTFSTDEANYSNYPAYIQKAKYQLSDALDSYKKVSSTIYAPAAGVVNNLTIAKGVVISNTSSSITVSTGTDSNSNSTTVTSHSVGSVTNPEGQYQATLSLAEADISKIKADQKVTMTMDAFSGKTFTGKILAVNVSGTTSSGVTTYPVIVLLDDTDETIYSGMAVTATIIISSKSDILLIPSTAIETIGESSTVRVVKNGKISTVTIETGDTNDSEIEVTSGLSEGDVIISSSTSNEVKTNNNTTSAFSRTTTRGGGSVGGMSSGGMPAGGPGGF